MQKKFIIQSFLTALGTLSVSVPYGGIPLLAAPLFGNHDHVNSLLAAIVNFLTCECPRVEVIFSTTENMTEAQNALKSYNKDLICEGGGVKLTVSLPAPKED